MSILDGKKPHIIVASGQTKVSGVDTPVGTVIRRLVPVNSPTLVCSGVISDYLVSLGSPTHLTVTGLLGGGDVTCFASYEKELKSVTAGSGSLIFAEYW